MKIVVATKNKAKIDAVKEIVKSYPDLKRAKISAREAESNVSDQPKNLKEIIQGARNRAKGAKVDADLCFGIESGIMKVPYTKTGYMDVSACAIYDGKEFHLGLSPCFEYPKNIIKIVHEKKVNISEAAKLSGLTKKTWVGAAEGVIGILTKNRKTRKTYTKDAIIMAMIHLENKKLF